MKSKNIFIAFILNLFFSIFEIFGGIFTNSVAITSDAIHDFGDAISIGISYFLEKTSGKKPNAKYTYGYLRFSVLGGFITTAILLIGSAIVIYNAVLKIITPEIIDYNKMLIFAVVGVIVNLVATYFTHGGKSINQRVVNLHMLEDVFGWIAVLIGAIVMRFTNFYIIDPILSIIISLFIIVNCIKNLIKIGDVFLIKTPKEINVDKIISHLASVEGVLNVHHFHVWTIDGESHLASLHVVVKEYSSEVKNKVKKELEEHNITHSTIEIETENERCHEQECHIKRTKPCSCHHHH